MTSPRQPFLIEGCKNSDINWIILKNVEEGHHGIDEGCVIDLSPKPNGNAVVVDVILPDLLENRVWLPLKNKILIWQN